MSGVFETLEVKLVVWPLSALLWALRAASTPWVWFCALLALYGLLGFRLSGHAIPAGIAAIGCTACVWLHTRLYRELTFPEDQRRSQP